MKKPYLISIGSLFLLGLLIFAWFSVYKEPIKPVSKDSVTQDEKLKITASFYPLAFLADAVGGDKVEVVNLTPAGAEPHDFEPTPKDLVNLYASDLVIYSGAGMEPWLEKLTPELASKNIILLNASQKINLLELESLQSQVEHKDHDHQEGHEHTSLDPHFWLDPSLFAQFAESISSALVQLKPEFKNEFSERLKALQTSLDALDSKYRSELATCQLRDVVVSHEAYNYLAKRYTINMYAISGISPEAEPSPSRLKVLKDLAVSKNIDYVFFESLASPAVSQTLAKEIGAQTLVLNPIEGLTQEDVALGTDYFSIMEENLKNLRTALKCQ